MIREVGTAKFLYRATHQYAVQSCWVLGDVEVGGGLPAIPPVAGGAAPSGGGGGTSEGGGGGASGGGGGYP